MSVAPPRCTGRCRVHCPDRPWRGMLGAQSAEEMVQTLARLAAQGDPELRHEPCICGDPNGLAVGDVVMCLNCARRSRRMG